MTAPSGSAYDRVSSKIEDLGATARRWRWRFMLLFGFTLGYVISDLWEKLT